MFVKDVLDKARLRLDDVVADSKGNYLWSNDELLDYCNESERELARKAQLLFDASTAAICTHDVFPGLPTLSIDRRIVEVNAAYLTNSQRPLFRKTVKYFDSHIAMWGWQSLGWRSVEDMPVYYIPNYEPRKIRFYPYYPTTYQGTVYFATGNLIFDSGAGTIALAAGGLSIFLEGSTVLISGTTSNNGLFTVGAGGTDILISVDEAVVSENASAGTIKNKIDTLNLEVARLPLADVLIQDISTASPEVDEDYHMNLIDGIMSRAYLKRDSETYQLQEAAKFKKIWEDFIEDAKNDQIIITESDTIFEPSYGAI